MSLSPSKRTGLYAYLRSAVGALSWKAALALLLMLLISLTEGIGLLMLVPLLELTGFSVGAGPANRVAEAVRGVFQGLGLPLSLPAVLGVYVVIVSARALLSRFESVSSFALQQLLVAQLRERLYHALTAANWLFFVRSRTSDFMHTLTRELEIVGAATFTLLSWLVTLTVSLTYFAFALFLAPLMTLLVLLSGVVLLLLLRLKTSLAKGRGEKLARAYEDMYGALSEHLAGMKVAKGHGLGEAHAKLFLNMTRGVERAHVEVVKNSAAVSFYFQLGSALILAVIVYAALSVLALSSADILLLLYLFSRLIPMFSGLQSGYGAFLSYLPAFERVKALEAACAEAAEPTGTATPALKLRRALSFKDVSFAYEGAEPVLRGLRLTLQAGRTTAVVGSSGAGKSTLADLAVGLLSPQAGEVLVDGVALSAQALPAWRQSLGYVTQDTFLFHDTVRANLLLMRPQASDAELWEALEMAAADFVTGLPQGLDTPLGDRGVRLSGGERQRLALARALLRRPTLLVLDEATSSLDAENEARIQQAIEALHGQVTMLIIAHRLSTVRHADVIHVLEAGRLVESGDWETLVRQQGRFRSLCQAQGWLVPPPNAPGTLSFSRAQAQ
jgi:ATP-binding cassette subfamily C protein